jgi:hypothetical protein
MQTKKYRVSTKELYFYKIIQTTSAACLGLHTHTVGRKTLKVLFQMTRVLVVECLCKMPLVLKVATPQQRIRRVLQLAKTDSVTAMQCVFRRQFHSAG